MTDVQDLIASLGEPMTADSDIPLLPLSNDSQLDDASDLVRASCILLALYDAHTCCQTVE